MGLSVCAPAGQGLGSPSNNEGSNNTMFKSTRKSKMVKVAAAAAAVGSIAAIGFVGNSPAQADPQFLTALVGTGSDTTQDVMNALAGYAPAPGGAAVDGIFTPAIASNGQQLLSFNALNPDPAGDTCITTKLGGPAFDRPNGSSNGRRSLSRAEDTTGWGSAACGGLADVSGQIDFARSSDGPASGDTGTDLTYSVLGRDAISLAFYRNGVAGNTIDPLTSTSSLVKTRWTRAELTALYSAASGAAKTFTADDGVSSISVLACGIQTGSGTYKSVLKTFNVSAGQDATAVNVCSPDAANRLQENDAAGLKAKGDANPGVQVVIGFAAGPYVAKSNGVASPNPQTNATGLAAITDDGAGNNLGVAITSSGGTFGPVASFYNNSIFGRTVYNVVPTSKIDSLFGNVGLKSMFKDPDVTVTGGVVTNGPLKAAICENETTIETFGFLASEDCGNTLLKGTFLSGQINS